MKVANGKVVVGKVVVQKGALPEGALVTVFAREPIESFAVPAELEPELLASLAEADRGETLSADELLNRLRRRN